MSCAQEAAAVRSGTDPAKRRRPNCVSRLLFSWVSPVVAVSSRNAVEDADLFDIPERSKVSRLLSAFDRRWHAELTRTDAPSGRAWLFPAVKRMFGVRLFQTGVILFLQHSLQLVVPLLVQRYLDWFGDEDSASWQGWAYGGGAALAMLLAGAICSNHALMKLYVTGMDVRSLCIALVSRKSMRLSQRARTQVNIAQVLDLISSDCEQLPMFLLGIHALWLAPIFIVLSVALLVRTVGLAAAVGCGVLLVTLPIPAKISRALMKATQEQEKQASRRIKAVSEGLSCIRVLKYEAWDVAYMDAVARLRTTELGSLKRIGRLQGAMLASMMATPLIIGLCMTVAFFFLDRDSFTPSKVFTSLMLINLVRMPLSMLPMGLRGRSELKASLQRLQTFLSMEEVEIECGPELVDETPSDGKGTSHVSVSDASFRWTRASDPPKEKKSGEKEKENRPGFTLFGVHIMFEREEKKKPESPRAKIRAGLPAPWLDAVVGKPAKETKAFCLLDISLEVKAGQLLSVVGLGKSSLLKALLQEMPKQSGELAITGKVAYCSQEPWIFNGSLQENILFNTPMEEQRYADVVGMCFLDADFRELPNGDFTEVGDNGVALTDAQTAKIALARACYSGASIFILDEVLSVMDRLTGARIFEKCIRRLTKEGKAIVLTTSEVRFLSRSDVVCVLEDQRIAGLNKYSKLKACKSGGLLRVLGEGGGKEEQPNVALSPKAKPLVLPSCRALDRDASAWQPPNTNRKSVSRKIWWFYFVECSGGRCLPIGMFIVLLLAQGAKSFCEWWLGHWTDQMVQKSLPQPNQLMFLYVGLGVTSVFFVLCRSLLLAKFISRNAEWLHWQLLSTVLMAPMGYFETTPLSQTMHLFNNDMESLGTQFHQCLPTLAALCTEIVGLCMITGISLPLFFAFWVPLLVLFWYVLRQFAPLSGDLKRLESGSRWPISEQVHEIFSGVTTIRAFGQSQHYLDACCEKIDSANRAYFTTHSANRWLQLRLECFGTLFFIAVVVCFRIHGRGNVPIGIAGLIVFYAQGCSQFMSYAMHMTIELEARMAATARIYQSTTSIEPEAPLVVVEQDLPLTGWPSAGRIQFENVSMRYQADSPLILNKLSFVVEGGLRVGICGPAGSGKSTLFNVLFRVNDIFKNETCGEGSISLDGVDIGSLGLHELRRSLAIVPQDPMMFAGTVKENLDIFDQHTEEELWSAIQAASLWEVLQQLPEGLAAPVQEGGRNFSCEHRQLICLARALLRRRVPMVVCIDEAMSHDSDTDDAIWSVLESEFTLCTVLISAQRLNTAANCDLVLYLEEGAVAEYDTPSNLLEQPAGKFCGLVYDMGIVPAAHLEARVRGAPPEDIGVLSL